MTPENGLTVLWEERFDSSGSTDFLYPHVGFRTYTLTMGTANDGVQIQEI